MKEDIYKMQSTTPPELLFIFIIDMNELFGVVHLNIRHWNLCQGGHIGKLLRQKEISFLFSMTLFPYFIFAPPTPAFLFLLLPTIQKS